MDEGPTSDSPASKIPKIDIALGTRGFTESLALATGAYFSLSGDPIWHWGVPIAGLVLGFFKVERAIWQKHYVNRFQRGGDYLSAVLGTGVVHGLAILVSAALIRLAAHIFSK